MVSSNPLQLILTAVQTFNYQLTMDDANKMAGGNIKDYGSSSEKLKELYDILNPKD